MEKSYEGHDGIVNAPTFHNWVMISPGVKQVYDRTDVNLGVTMIYRYKDATIQYRGSGDHKDGAPIAIEVESDTKQTLEEICSAIEKWFPKLS